MRYIAAEDVVGERGLLAAAFGTLAKRNPQRRGTMAQRAGEKSGLPIGVLRDSGYLRGPSHLVGMAACLSVSQTVGDVALPSALCIVRVSHADFLHQDLRLSDE